MKCIGLIATFAVLGASPALAQDPVFTAQATTECMRQLDDLEACVGASARACMASVPGGDSTIGMSFCLGEELTYWDDRLNVSYQSLMAIKKKEDKEFGGSGPSGEETLRDMQRAWISYRDARCEYERSKWGGGTGGTPAAIECHMMQTALQAVILEMGSNPN